MLEPKTVEKLQTLIDSLNEHDRSIKKLLTDALISWQRFDCSPIQESFGIFSRDGIYTTGYFRKACLIGASLLNEESSGRGRKIEDCSVKYGIHSDDICNIIDNFDGESKYWYYSDLISEVRDIVKEDLNFTRVC